MKRLSAIFITISYLFLSFSGNAFSQETEKSIVIFISADDARLIAINNNLDIKLARLDSKIKGTELSYKEAAFDTILNGDIGYTRDERKSSSPFAGSKSMTNDYNIGLDKKLKTGTDIELDFTNKREWSDSSFVTANPYHESEIGISLTQPIAKNFFGLIDRGNVETVKWEIKNAELDSYIKIEDSMISVEKAYWKLVLSQEEFRIKKDMLKKAVRLFNQYRRKLKIGLTETGEVLASEANMHIRKNDLLMAANELKSAEELLKIRLNIKNDIKLFATDKLLDTKSDVDLIKSLNRAFKNRRDYIYKKNEVEVENINLKMKRNSLYPEIDLKATFATNGLDSKYYNAIEGISEDSNPKYYIGVEFSYPLENNEAKSLHEKASLKKTKAIVNLQKTERQIFSDIDENLRKVSVNESNTKNMQRVENLQKGKLYLEEQRFKYGRSNSDTLIRYQEDVLNAKLLTKKAYFDYKTSILDLLGAEDNYLKNIGLE
ncbi:MAG: TolC family protein [Candidatus Omnitrophica bacterium]|nr:TolC family protein [Candidatus Omnitrophota bacterium]